MSHIYFIQRHKPDNFFPKVEAAGCCCTFENKILLLKRHPNKIYGNKWGVPGGKMEDSESIKECAIREIKEEAGLDIDDEHLKFIGSLYCKINQDNAPFEYIFHLFHKNFTSLPKLDIGIEEHVEAKWLTLEEAHQMPLIVGGKEVLEYYQAFKG